VSDKFDPNTNKLGRNLHIVRVCSVFNGGTTEERLVVALTGDAMHAARSAKVKLMLDLLQLLPSDSPNHSTPKVFGSLACFTRNTTFFAIEYEPGMNLEWLLRAAVVAKESANENEKFGRLFCFSAMRVPEQLHQHYAFVRDTDSQSSFDKRLAEVGEWSSDPFNRFVAQIENLFSAADVACLQTTHGQVTAASTTAEAAAKAAQEARTAIRATGKKKKKKSAAAKRAEAEAQKAEAEAQEATVSFRKIADTLSEELQNIAMHCERNIFSALLSTKLLDSQLQPRLLLIQHAAAGLAVLHQVGIAHCNISPRKLMVKNHWALLARSPQDQDALKNDPFLPPWIKNESQAGKAEGVLIDLKHAQSAVKDYPAIPASPSEEVSSAHRGRVRVFICRCTVLCSRCPLCLSVLMSVVRR